MVNTLFRLQNKDFISIKKFCALNKQNMYTSQTCMHITRVFHKQPTKYMLHLKFLAEFINKKPVTLFYHIYTDIQGPPKLWQPRFNGAL